MCTDRGAVDTRVAARPKGNIRARERTAKPIIVTRATWESTRRAPLFGFTFGAFFRRDETRRARFEAAAARALVSTFVVGDVNVSTKAEHCEETKHNIHHLSTETMSVEIERRRRRRL